MNDHLYYPLGEAQGGPLLRVFLVEDQMIVRRGLAQLFSTEPGLLVCGEVEEFAGAFLKIWQTCPDLVLMDISLKDRDTFDLIERLRKAMPTLKIVVFSMHREPSYVVRAMKAGANDYLLKDEGPSKVILAIRALFASTTTRPKDDKNHQH